MLVLCGPPASGKDETRKVLVSDYDFISVVRYSTRPMRPGEIDGEAYNFTDNEFFKNLRERGMLAEYEEFLTAEDDKPWYYGSLADDYTPNHVMICSPDGIKMLKSGPMKDDIFVAQLFLPEDVMRERLAAERNWSEAELERRIASDRKRYADIKMLVDVIVPSYGDAYPPERVAELIYRSYAREMEKKEISLNDVPELN